VEAERNLNTSKRFSPPEPVRDFNALVYQAIDRTLEEAIGSKAAGVVEQELRAKQDPDQDKLPNRVDVVCSALEDAFGAKGAQAVEWMMLKHVYDRIQLPIEVKEGLTFEDFLELAKQRLNRDQYYTWVKRLSKSW